MVKSHSSATRDRAARRRGRPRDVDKRQAIIDAGWAEFLKNGVGGAKVERIAAAAGVSKVTIYAHFADKPALFEAAMRQRMDVIAALQTPSLPASSLREALFNFGLGLMRFLASEEAIDFYNILSGELRRHPDLALRFYSNGPQKTLENLAGIIRAASEGGALRGCDPDRAAEELFGLWQGASNYTLALGMHDDALITGLPDRVARGIDVFLAVYGPPDAGKAGRSA